MPMGELDRAARFNQVFDSYLSDITAYCSWRCCDREDAEDSVADVFLVAWRRLSDIPEGGAARVWLYATARRVTANRVRSRRRQARLLERVAAASRIEQSPPEDPLADVVRDVLRRLKPRDQEVLYLAEWEGLSSGEIATVLRCSAVSARGRLHRARRRFRQGFETARSRQRKEQPQDASGLSNLLLSEEPDGSRPLT